MYDVTIIEEDKTDVVWATHLVVGHNDPGLVAKALVEEFKREDEANGRTGITYRWEIEPFKG